MLYFLDEKRQDLVVLAVWHTSQDPHKWEERLFKNHLFREHKALYHLVNSSSTSINEHELCLTPMKSTCPFGNT